MCFAFRAVPDDIAFVISAIMTAEILAVEITSIYSALQHFDHRKKEDISYDLCTLPFGQPTHSLHRMYLLAKYFVEMLEI